MEISTSFSLEYLAALESLSTEKGRDAYSAKMCAETVLAPGKSPALSRRLNPVLEKDIVEQLKAEGLDEKIGGLLKVYLKDTPAENASLLDLYNSHSRINSLLEAGEIALDQAHDAQDYLLGKYIGEKLKNASEFVYYLYLDNRYLYLDNKFELKADVSLANVFGQKYIQFKDFKLEGCGEDIEIPGKFKDICETIMLHTYQNDLFLLESKEDRLKPILPEKEAQIEDFIAKVTAKYCQKV